MDVDTSSPSDDESASWETAEDGASSGDESASSTTNGSSDDEDGADAFEQAEYEELRELTERIIELSPRLTLEELVLVSASVAEMVAKRDRRRHLPSGRRRTFNRTKLYPAGVRFEDHFESLTDNDIYHSFRFERADLLAWFTS